MNDICAYSYLFVLQKVTFGFTSLWQIIADSLKNFKLCVSIKRHRPKWFLVAQGVHQGGPLSSLLFQIFFDDLLKDTQNSNNGVKVYDTEIASPSFANDI